MHVWLAAAFVALFALSWQWSAIRRTKRALHEQTETLMQLQGAYVLLAAETERARWAEWWVRCGCETTLADPARPTVIRWALAAHLAPSLEQLHCDFAQIAADANRSQLERVHAAAFMRELDLRRRNTTPWAEWIKQPAVQGQPLHNPHALAAAYRAALASNWVPLLEGDELQHHELVLSADPLTTH
jgi:hypothetical protein